MGLKAGVIGCGRMGAERSNRLNGKIASGWLPISHTENLLNCENICSVILCESNEGRVPYLKSNYPNCKIYNNIDELLSKKVDIITIATRTPVKAQAIQQAIKHNVKGLYVEKPFSNSLLECESLLKQAEAKNVFVSYGVNRRFHNTYRKIKKEINDGIIGKLTHIVADFGSGGLFWTHAHSMDLLLYFGGTPKKIRAQLDNVESNEAGDVENDPTLIDADIEFQNGIKGTITNIPGYNLKLVGETGIIYIHADATFVEKHLLCSQTGNFTKHQIEYPLEGNSATMVALQELTNAVISQNDKQLKEGIKNSEILMGLKMIFGCVDSHRQGGIYINLKNLNSNYKIHAISFGNPA